jgi:outer membrane protein TolC
MRSVTKIIVSTSFTLLVILNVQGQMLTLDECQQLARENYPAVKQKKLVHSSKEYSMANIRSAVLPQVAIYGQATYQSDVTNVSIEGAPFRVEPLSKDQYKLYGEVTQTLYDGGVVKHQIGMHEASAQVEDQRVEIELYRIKERINQLYFGTLLIDEQLSQVELVRKDIQTSLKQVDAAIRNGTALKTNADILNAELLKLDQREIELKASRDAYLQMLSLFVNRPLPAETLLQKPQQTTISAEEVIQRPELTLYNYQSEFYESQYSLTSTKLLPKVGLFLQGGFGRPGLNMLKNEFAAYYIGGVRLSWNLSGFYNSNRDKQLLNINLQTADVQKETFLFNTKLALRQQSREIEKLEKLISVDDQLIAIRTDVKKVSKVQLDNGVITANDFLKELNAEDQAVQAKILHEIQLLMMEYNYKLTTGE